MKGEAMAEPPKKKGILKAGDDAILPMIMKALIGNYIIQTSVNREKWNATKNNMNHYLHVEVSRLPPRLRSNFEQRLLRAHRKVYNYMGKNKWKTIKALMVIIRVAELLEEEGKIRIEPIVLKEYLSIRAKITHDMGFTDAEGEPLEEERELTEDEQKSKDDLLAIYNSAEKQAPKIIRMLRTQGYF